MGLNWLRYEWHTPPAIIGAALSSLSRLASGRWGTAMLIVGVIFVAAAAVGAVLNRKRVDQLEKRAVQAEQDRDAARGSLASLTQVSHNVYRSLLFQLATELELGDQERVSLYLHDGGNLPSFQLICRHARDPTLEAASGRKVYPDDQGIIGAAWRLGWAEETGLPDPVVSGPAYVGENFSRYRLPTEVTEGLAMKSRVLAASRYPSSGVGDKYIGVLVFESLNVNWDISTLRADLTDSQWWLTLQDHLQAQRQHLPALSTALDAGF